MALMKQRIEALKRGVAKQEKSQKSLLDKKTKAEIAAKTKEEKELKRIELEEERARRL